jgi:deazaflavin-dependent oxidoreductase (nitroreductase family)
MGVAPRWYELPMSFEDFNRNLIKDLRAHGGKATSGPFQGRDVLILTTRGAKSGETRESPLAYTRDGDNLVVVASKGGAPSHPAWFHNLVTHPEVGVEAGGQSFEARAHVPQGEEYERLYKQHADILPTFHEYRKRTSRQIPVVVLERVNP